MNKANDSFDTATHDGALSAKYRLAATESAPERLNKAVIRSAAKRESRAPAILWSRTWLQPTALVAVIGLSIALIFDADDPEFGAVPHNGIATERDVGRGNNPFEAATTATVEQIRAADTAARLNPGTEGQQKPTPGMLDRRPAEQQIIPAASHCDAEQRSTSVLWWQCVRALESGGNTAAATAELEALLAAYPAFELP